MSSARTTTIGFSIVSADGRTRIPRAVCERLRLKPGDSVRYRFAADGIVIDQTPRATGKPPYALGDPFAVFSEWSSEPDEAAYSEL